MSSYEDIENKFDSAFKTRMLLYTVLGVGSTILLLLGLLSVTGTIK